MSPPVLTRDTVLVRHPRLDLHLIASGEVEIVADGATCDAGPHALAVLDAFSKPRSIGDVVDASQPVGALDFAAFNQTILRLAAHGVLTPPDGRPELSDEGESVYASSSIHARMLGDVARTDAFLRAIQEVVRPTDVVLDIGTGVGILALGAARAGARRVFAVEASSIADFAEETFRRNDLSDRIELIRGWSTRVSVPERATVLVSYHALAEQIELTLDAKKRLLTPDARFVPSRIRIFLQPTTLPAAISHRHLFSVENTNAWKTTYGFDFSVLSDTVRPRPQRLALSLREARGWPRLGPPVLAAEIDLTQVTGATFAQRFAVTVHEAASFDAALEFFELELSPSVTLVVHPDTSAPDCHWRFPIWVMPRPVAARAGTPVPMRYSFSGQPTLTLE